ncbi:MAG: HesA/MoeB/ThiF family protein [Fluviibacter sp.]|jgi:molybdopterin-synthase adenylyltransferase
MNDQQLLRYSRHILVDEIGIEGQEKLLASHALIIGAGGLGSPAALYLASAGVGTLSIADGDTVDLSNLQRQILHTESRIGLTKTQSAAEALHTVNPECRVNPLPRLEGNALIDAVDQADVVLDCSDNFTTRYALNRACLRTQTPLVSGAAIKLTGQLFVMDPRQTDTPCYACLYPEDSADDDLRCATTGILAPLTGVIGCMQAVEAIKLLAGFGTPAAGLLQRYDALSGTWSSARVQPDPACPACNA